MNKSSNNNRQYDLEERTAKFAEELIDFLKKLPLSPLNKRIIEQLVGCVGSIGANYCEATESKKDFIHKVGICKKETKETRHWLRLLARVHPECKEKLREFWKEAQELLLIFSKTIKTSKGS